VLASLGLPYIRIRKNSVFVRNSEFFSHNYVFFLIIPVVIARKISALLLKT
jgi:hypothetical protein